MYNKFNVQQISLLYSETKWQLALVHFFILHCDTWAAHGVWTVIVSPTLRHFMKESHVLFPRVGNLLVATVILTKEAIKEEFLNSSFLFQPHTFTDWHLGSNFFLNKRTLPPPTLRGFRVHRELCDSIVV